ncbi:MAG: FapA family protein [Bacillota bacterium]|nr:FapA family protein [Bacillota bacterium]
MPSTVFKGDTVEECVQKAASFLKIDSENLVYTINKEKKSLFGKSVSISVDLAKNDIISESGKLTNDSKIYENDGTVKVADGRIIIKNPKENGKAAVIRVSSGIEVTMNSMKVNNDTNVYEDSEIKVVFPETNPARNMNIKINEDRTSSYLSISYEPKKLFKLKDKEESNEIYLESEISEEIWPKAYTSSEIKNELTKNGIIYGFIEENIKRCEDQKGVNNILAAQSDECINDEDDKIIIKFQTENKIENLFVDDKGKIDFKSIGVINSVCKNQILAERVPGRIGHNGKSIFGKETIHKEGKKIKLNVGEGCTLKDENTVVALREGKPLFKNNKFYVYEFHNVSGDVDLTTGNVKFIGDVVISGDVKEGMKVESGNSIKIEKNIQQSEIIAKGNIEIKGNIITSTVIAGGENVQILNQIKIISSINSILKEIINNIEEIKKFNLLGYDTGDGKIIKLLIEQKYKELPRMCLTYITLCSIIKFAYDVNDKVYSEIISLMKEKIIGLGPLNIKNYGELDEIISLIDKEITNLRSIISLPVNIVMSYCQESIIKSSGNITIIGKGVYVSDVTASDSICFTESNSIVRGGRLNAENTIKCRVVGTTSGVETELIVGEKGNIYSDIVYPNTKFIVGKKEYIVDKAGKNIHAYNDEEGCLVVDMLTL